MLRTAAEQGLVDVPVVLARLKATNFYVEDALIETLFKRWLSP